MTTPRIVETLAAEVAGCGRRVTLKEIQDAVANSARVFRPATTSIRPSIAAPKWPARDAARIAQITRDGPGLADLWERSPWRFEDNEAHTEMLIDQLFPGDPLLCCGKSQEVFATHPRETWRGSLAELQFIVPSPMSAPTGTTQDGRESAHCLANTGPRRFLVVEFDQGDIDTQAALVLHLGEKAPLTLALHSGGKSVHAWFHCAGQTDETLRKFFSYAVSLGADRATWCRSQFVRMPDGTRDNGAKQTVYYFDPETIL